jgi:hypothetical protein
MCEAELDLSTNWRLAFYNSDQFAQHNDRTILNWCYTRPGNWVYYSLFGTIQRQSLHNRVAVQNPSSLHSCRRHPTILAVEPQTLIEHCWGGMAIYSFFFSSRLTNGAISLNWLRHVPAILLRWIYLLHNYQHCEEEREREKKCSLIESWLSYYSYCLPVCLSVSLGWRAAAAAATFVSFVWSRSLVWRRVYRCLNANIRCLTYMLGAYVCWLV